VSLQLNAGVPAPTVDVLLRAYANCIDGTTR
jgi:hypothetical protein